MHGIVLTRPPNVRTDGTAASLEEAKVDFQKCWDAWKALAKHEEVLQIPLTKVQARLAAIVGRAGQHASWIAP